jgi:hypothetical protein
MQEDPPPRPPQLEIPVAPAIGRATTARRRLLVPALVVGLALVIAGLGVLGPKPERALPAVIGSPAPANVGPTTSPSGTPVPLLRRAGGLLTDPWLLHGGRWADLEDGTGPGVETGCELEPSFVLAGGRIVCVAQAVTRSPGSRRATYDLSVITLGHGRTRPDDPGPTGPPAAALPGTALPRVPLTTLSGRRDLVIGDPVAIALAPAAEADTLLLAWAVLDDAGYRVGLDRYHVGDDRVVRTGSRPIAALPASGPDAISSLADLAVSVAPNGQAALVGFTAIGSGAGVPARRLAVLGMRPGSPDASIDAPTLLSPAVAASAPGPPGTELPGARVPCGGALDEGWATDASIFLVCPGRPSTLRRVAFAPGSSGGTSDPGGPSVQASILDEIVLGPEPAAADAVSLAGNGVAIDRLHGRYDRWSPSTGALWSIDLAAAPGAQVIADSAVLGAAGRAGAGDPFGDGPAVRSILALDAAKDRIYALVPATDGSGATVEVFTATTLARIASWPTAPEPFATLALSPNGGLLYLATPPRVIVGAPRPLVAVEVLDAMNGQERLFAGRLSPDAWGKAQSLVIR